MADTLSPYYKVVGIKPSDYATLQFISTMVQMLNLTWLTASELHDLQYSLARNFENEDVFFQIKSKVTGDNEDVDDDKNGTVFATLFHF
jgi:hypothetical protein